MCNPVYTHDLEHQIQTSLSANEMLADTQETATDHFQSKQGSQACLNKDVVRGQMGEIVIP